MAPEPALKAFPKRSRFRPVPFPTSPLGLHSAPMEFREVWGAESLRFSRIPGDLGNLPWEVSASGKALHSPFFSILSPCSLSSSILTPDVRESSAPRPEEGNPLSSQTLKSSAHFLLMRAADRLDSCHRHTCFHKFLVHKHSLRFYYVPGIVLAPVRDTKALDPSLTLTVGEDDKLQTCNSKVFKVPF